MSKSDPSKSKPSKGPKSVKEKIAVGKKSTSSNSQSGARAASISPPKEKKTKPKVKRPQKTSTEKNPGAENPLILRFHRLIDAFSKADDERDFYLNRHEGYLLFDNLDKQNSDIEILDRELRENPKRYSSIPKLSFYEQKKLMEGFVNEKVYDIDTKEKLSDIISSKNPRENFLEYLLDAPMENEKWQLYYLERCRIKIIEWLREEGFTFVFEEDLELPSELVEKVKKNLFISKAPKEVIQVRRDLEERAKVYYQSEALNPRPKRGRPPKQIVKVEVQPQISADVFTTVPTGLHPFLFVPDLNSPSDITFSSRFGTHAELLEFYRKATRNTDNLAKLEELSHKLSNLQDLSLEKAAPSTVRNLEESPRIPQPTMESAFEANGASRLSIKGSKRS